jgi:dTDP-4-amino-4,6-dideoxygalactose transaminase
MDERIPPLDLSSEIREHWDELNDAIQRVLRSGQFILGPEVEAFENEVADFLGVRHAIGLSSGTDALIVGLRALGITAGDEVITTAFTFVATAETISLLGAVPVFVDIDPKTFNLDVSLIAERLTPRTKAILPVHLFGHAAEMDGILGLADERGIAVFEDAAQAFGGRYKGRMLGGIGTAGAFSFFPTKNLGAYGDAGLLVTNDDGVARQTRMLRVHGSIQRDATEVLGYNARLDALQAAILRTKLKHVPVWNAARRRAAAVYTEMLADVEAVLCPTESDYAEHAFHQYTVRIRDGRRDAARASLADMGIATMVYYAVPVHQLPVYRHLEIGLPETEAAAREVLSLPIWPQITPEQQKRVGTALRQVLK